MTEAKGPAPVAPAAATNAGVAASEETKAISAFARLKKRVVVQTWVIVVLSVFLAGVVPFARPIYLFYAMNPEHKVMRLSGMDKPNMTNRAILSWATTSITEVMTMGFGDMDVKLPQQKQRFTKKGWEAYLKIFVDQQIGKTFKQSQLVLTTVPSNTPVIIWQGVNPSQAYEWVVQMPVIMTYATNNNVMSKKNATVTLTIVRVPVEESSFGIAIQSWIL